MNLIDLLTPKICEQRQTRAKRAEGAENQNIRRLESSPCRADQGGSAPGISSSPPAEAESSGPVTKGVPPNPPNPPNSLSIVETPLPVTKEYFSTHGVRLMPEDLAYLRQHLPRATKARNQAIREYLVRWLEAMASEPLAHRKDNAGRRIANRKLISPKCTSHD